MVAADGGPGRLTRRALIAAGAGIVAAPALAQAPECLLGLPDDRERGPAVFLDYDQAALDAAYDQDFYQAHLDRTNRRLAALSGDFRVRRGFPERAAYGDGPSEGLDIYRAAAAGAPVFVFVHGGTWRHLDAAMSAFAGEMFLDAGASFVALDFANVAVLDGDLRNLADQVRRGIAWVARNAAGFGADPDRIYLGGHSSGAHLAAVALVTDWQRSFDLPPDVIKGGLCLSGMYELAPVALSWRRHYIAFDDAMVAAMSPQRHVERLACPVVVGFGTHESPEFQRQAEDFAAAVAAAGKPVELVTGFGYHHQDMWEALGNPYAPSGRAALAMMGLARG